MKKILIIVIVFASLNVVGWGVTGHRTIGYIAQQHLSKKATKEVARVLKRESLAIVTTWMDEVRSDSTYNLMTFASFCEN